MTGKKNILFIEFQERTSAIHLLPVISLLKKRGHRVFLLGQTNTYLTSAAKSLGIKTYTLKYVEFNFHKLITYFYFFRTLLLVSYLVLRHRIKIIHCHRLNWAYLGIIVSRVFRLSLFIDIVYMEKLTSTIQNFLIDHDKKGIYLTISDFVGARFTQLYQIPPERVITFCPGLNLKPGSVKKTKINDSSTLLKNIPSNKKLVAMISRLDPLKGVHIFIEAAGILKNKWPGVHFLFLGRQKNIIWKENYYEECLARIHNLGLEKQFSILDFEYDINSLYKFFYLTVLPTLKDALAYVALESQANKKPVIITKVEGTPETVNYGKAGILIPYPPSPVILAQEIDKLLKSKKLYSFYSKRGYQWIKKKFDIDKNILFLEALYKKKP